MMIVTMVVERMAMGIFVAIYSVEDAMNPNPNHGRSGCV